MKLNQNDLKKFCLVYAADAPEMDQIALSLKTLLKEKLGVAIDCLSDAYISDREYEILLGCTKRAFSRACYTEGGVAPMTYRVILKGTKLQIACGGAASATAFLKALEQLIAEGAMPEEVDEGTYMETELTGLSVVPLTAGSTLRVMTSNVLTHCWEGGRGYPSVAHRAEMYAATLNIYQPNLIGIQETDLPWIDYLPYYFEALRVYSGGRLDYACLGNCYVMPDGAQIPCYTSLIYRKDRFDVLESGIEAYPYAVKEWKLKCRTCTWGIYRDRTDGEVYGVFNTHWSFTAEETEISIRIGLETVRDKQSKYPGLHVFCTGDFNNHLNKSIEKFSERSGFGDSKDEAKKNGSLINENPGIPEGIYIDHIFFNEGVTVTRHETIDARYTQKMSDHMLQYGDFLILK